MSQREDRLLWALVAVAAIVALMGAALVVVIVPSLLVVVLMAIAAVFAAVFLVMQWQSSRQESLLRTLAIAAERGVSLTSALEAFAGQSSGRARRAMLALAGTLEAGAPLPQALVRVRGIIPRDAELLIGVGWACGTLPRALREAADLRSTHQPLRAMLATRSAYLVFMLVVIQAISSFVLYFIVPKFEAISIDFGVPLPQVTVMVIEASHVLVGPFAPILAVTVLGEALFLLLLPFSMVGWLDWDVPLVDWFVRRKHAALVLRALAWVIEAGRPLAWGLETLVRFYPSAWVRGRLDGALGDLAEGADCWTALRKRGLIRPADTALLESASRLGNLPWALRTAADASERRFRYRAQVVIQALGALAVLGLGVLVLFLTSAYFAPLIAIMRRLEG